SDSFYDQLRRGIRYLDIRLWNANGDFHGYHGDFLLTASLDDLFGQIARFKRESPSEVVILHIHYLNDCNDADCARLLSRIFALLSDAGTSNGAWLLAASQANATLRDIMTAAPRNPGGLPATLILAGLGGAIPASSVTPDQMPYLWPDIPSQY